MLSKTWKSSVRRVGVALTALLAAPIHTALAQGSDVDPFDWAYAPAFGAGVYRLGDGGEARIYRVPLSFRVRKTPEWDDDSRGGPGVRLLLPITAGISNNGSEVLPLRRLSDPLAQTAALPGVELELPVGKIWTLRTGGQVGYGEERTGSGRSARLAAVDVRSRLRWEKAPGRPALINGLKWAGFDASDGARGSLLRLTNALEFDISVPRWQWRGQSMRLLPHILDDRYFRPPPALALGPNREAGEVDDEWQVGLAAGREQGFKILFFRFDSLGVAYRFSDHSSGIRLYLNSVF
jgi:hypothetical protein